jgi:acyl-coenzyme A thioesterase PaaI-like protein
MSKQELQHTVERPSGNARQAAAQATRHLAHALVAHAADDETLTAVAEQIRQAHRQLAAAPPRSRAERLGTLLPKVEDQWSVDDMAGVLIERPIAGASSPVSAEVSLRNVGDEIVADVYFGPAFEGAPDRVHGGMVAAVFDDVLSAVPARVGEPAYTARLTVEYLAPVPVGTTVELHARLDHRQGRKIFATADARQSTTVLARSEALFVTVTSDHFRAS